MKTRIAQLVVALVLLSTSGCYHARVNTGLTPSAQTIERPFASSWIFGLVPPAEVTTAQECRNGVALVETELSFVNQLVGFVTAGIYTPMSIKVTCAASSGASREASTDTVVVLRDHSDEAVVAAFSDAAQQAAASHRPVYVQFR